LKHRLYLPGPLTPQDVVTLDRERAHYLTRVLRLRRGEAIVCFDGAGSAYQARLSDATARTATLQLGDLLVCEAPPIARLHLAQGLLKGAAMDQVVQKATELGATDLWLVQAGRSNVSGDADRLARKCEHWQRVIESASEQCGALHLPRLHSPRTLAALCAEAPAARIILLDPGAPPLPLDLPRESLLLLIGPEGGWSASEREVAVHAGAVCHGLGDRVLRAETAPLAVLAALRHSWGWR